MLPSQRELHRLFEYDAVSGVLTRKVGTSRSPVGSVVGTVGNRHGHLRVALRHGGKWKSHWVHRIVWKWMTGEDPELIDHLNRDASDNRWINLRTATKSQNLRNSCQGERIGWVQERNGRYRAGIKRQSIGTFDTEYAARKAIKGYM